MYLALHWSGNVKIDCVSKPCRPWNRNSKEDYNKPGPAIGGYLKVFLIFLNMVCFSNLQERGT